MRIQGDEDIDKETPFRRLEYKRLLSNDSSDELIIEKKNIINMNQILQIFSLLFLLLKN